MLEAHGPQGGGSEVGIIEVTRSNAQEHHAQTVYELRQKLDYQAEIIAMLKTDLVAARREASRKRRQTEYAR